MSSRRRGSTVTSLMLRVAIGPTLVMLVVVGLSLYVARLAELRGDIEDRGRLLASMLAETCRYGVISGNTPTLDLTLHGMVRADPSIASIQIFDSNRKLITSIDGLPHGAEPAIAFEQEIRGQKLDIELFDRAVDPRFPSESGVAASQGRVVGYAIVGMSTAPLEAAKRKYFYFTALMSLIAASAAVIFGLWQAKFVREPVGRVLGALKDLRQGRFNVHVLDDTGGELGELERMTLEVADSLAASTHRLEQSVSVRTTELQRAKELAEVANNEVRSLVARGNSQLEDERKRIAIELHDSMGATLIVLKLKAQHIAHLVAATTNESELQQVKTVAIEISHSIDGLYDKVRRTIKQLRPEVLDTLGLRGAMEEMVRDYDALHPECQFTLYAGSADLRDVPSDVSIAAYRLVQEALSNVVKHAQATRAEIVVERHSSPSELMITVTDNGQGFNPEGLDSGRATLGLVGMRERVSAMGGSMAITRASPVGACVQFRLPVG